MPIFVDPTTGDHFENDEPDAAARAQKYGFITQEEYAHQQELKESDQGAWEDARRGLLSGLGNVQNVAREIGFQPPIAGSEAFGPGGGMPMPALGEPALQAPVPPPGAETFPEGFDEQAAMARERSPIAFGAGQGLASAPFAAIAGAGAGALGGPALLGTAVGGVLTEAAVEGAMQEYSDAYFEERPFELKRVAANTFLFGGADYLFRGGAKLAGAALFGKAAKPGALGSRNVVSEAQGAAREFVDPVGGGSVGAARAADLEEPFVDAIKQMPDSQARVLARDADDHLHLVSQDASESFTRLNNGLSDDLGSQLKYEDIATYAQELDPKTLQRQADWWTEVSEQSRGVVEQLSGRTAGTGHQLDFGNLGKRVAQTIDDFNRRISSEVDAGRRNILVDEFKKQLDARTVAIDASHSVDRDTRNALKELIAPTRETLRKGLENKKLFGGAADLQKSLNPHWHGLLEHWRKVQDELTEKTGHIEFDNPSASRIQRESTVDLMRAKLGKDPRTNQEFGKHLRGALENIQGLIDARQAHGIARKDGLDALEGDIRNLMEDWNLAQTIGTARNRVKALKDNPRDIVGRMLNISETLPMVGKTIGHARTLGDVLQDVHLDPKTAVGRVWDTAYKRFAQNPSFSDPVIIGNYSPWVADALKNRGGKFMPPTPSGAVGSPAMPGMPPANVNAQRSVAQPSISPAAQVTAGPDFSAFPLKQRVKLADVRASMPGMSREEQDTLLRQMQRDGKLVLYRDDNTRGLTKADKDSAMDINGSPRHLVYFESKPELGATGALDRSRARASQSGYVGMGTPETRDAVLSRLEKVWTAAEKETAHGYTHARFYEVNDALRGLGQMTPDVKADYERLAALFGKAVDQGATFRGTTMRGIGLTPEEAAKLESAGVLTAQGFMSSSTDTKVASQFTNFGSTAERDVPVLFEIEGRSGVPIGRGQSEVVHRPGTQFAVIGKRMQGEVPVYQLQEMGYAPGAESDAILGNVRVSDGATFSLTDIAKSPLGLGAAAAGGLGLRHAMAQEPEPPPQQAPEHAYRDAFREIGQAGDAHIKAIASDALRLKPRRGKDRDPLALFAGKRKIQDAVEETRERLDEIAADPMTLLEQLGGSAGDVGKTHPSVYMALVEKAGQVATYLQSVIPQRTATTLLDPVGAAPSFDRSWDYAARFVGATQPRAALREVARGTAPPEMLEAVQQNWPEVWEAFQIETLGQVQRMHAAGRHIPSEKLRRLDSLLGLGGQLDPSASQEVTQHMLAAQDAELARREQGGQATGAMPSSGPAAASFRTRLDAISAERQMGA